MKNYIIRFTGGLFAVLLISFCIISLTNMNKETNAASKPTKAHTEQQSNLETYTYKITKIDHTGYYGTSTKDQTGIYFVNENVPKGTKLNEGDTIKVSFPNNSYEEITNIEKIN